MTLTELTDDEECELWRISRARRSPPMSTKPHVADMSRRHDFRRSTRARLPVHLRSRNRTGRADCKSSKE
jgi:hypothetical protein